MSLTRDHLDAALAEVRVSPELRRRVMRGLHDQPRGGIQPRRALAACALALLLILFSVFAAPPIVRAAGRWFDRFFGGWLTEIEQYEALPTDARFEKWLSDYGRSEIWYPMQQIGEIGGVEAKVHQVTFRASEGFGDHCQLRVKYGKIPAFDLGAVKYVLSINGQDIDMREPLCIVTIRGEDVVMKLSELIGMGPTYPDRILEFPVEDWRVKEPLACVLKAEVGGDVYEIPFTFDPQEAHEFAVESAWDDVEMYDRFYDEEKQRIEHAAQNAVPVGITKRAGDVEFTLQYLSYTDGLLMLTTQVRGAVLDKYGFPTVWLENMEVEGVTIANQSSHRDSWDGDLLGLASEYQLLGEPPEESLIYIDVGDAYPDIRLAFKYRWKQKRVVLPADEAEEAEWIAQGKPASLE